jgi:phage shock protein C
MTSSISFATLILILFGAAFIIAVVFLLIVLSTRSKGEKVSKTHLPSMTIDQRLATLRSKEDRYVEERGRILSMVETGTLSADDADRLFDSLERETTHMSCPYCSEDIRVEAVKCRHCKQHLVEMPAGQKRLSKSRDRVISGVCGGVAEHLGMDASLMRILTVVVVFVTGICTGLIVYLVAAVIMPDE